METDQEWCLECGVARTIIARPPDWRIPLLVVAAVVLVIAAGLVFTLSRLGDSGTVTVVNPTTARVTPTLAAWETGEDGYTVLLGAEPSESAARRAGERLLETGRGQVGVLSVAQHPEMTAKGPWLIFSGRYPTYALARAAAARAVRQGESRAAPALVQRPGQG